MSVSENTHIKDERPSDVNLTIDGIPVTVAEGTTIMDAAKTAGIYIPSLCVHKDLCKLGLCRLCVVESNGRGKLIPSCANTVLEGQTVVTNSPRVAGIRKTIMEMVLADHKLKCKDCVRKNDCVILGTSGTMNIMKNRTIAQNNRPATAPVVHSDILDFDMDKCISCGRCVAACRQEQNIWAIGASNRGKSYRIVTAYDRPLAESPCTFCNRCAAVCPVGAISEHDRSSEIFEKLKAVGATIAVQIDPSLSKAIGQYLSLPEGTFTPGKLVSALRSAGFASVYDRSVTVNYSYMEESRELEARMKTGEKLPMLIGYSDGLAKFTRTFFLALEGSVSQHRSAERIFGETIAAKAGNTTCISVVTNNAEKYRENDTCIILTFKEIAKLLKLAALDFATLAEGAFDLLPEETGISRESISEIRTNNGKTIKTLEVTGFGDARVVMEKITKGECDADLVRVIAE